ncbi:hypothetical protein GQ457_17G002420 [Hibiscus cannabinus]
MNKSLVSPSNIDGTQSIPPQFILVASEKVSNHCFVSYKQQYSAICYWLLVSINTTILLSLVSCLKTCEIWEKVQQNFLFSSTIKIMHINLRKRDQSMKEYLVQIQFVCDRLAASRNPLTETMHIFAILFVYLLSISQWLQLSPLVSSHTNLMAFVVFFLI